MEQYKQEFIEFMVDCKALTVRKRRITAQIREASWEAP